MPDRPHTHMIPNPCAVSAVPGRHLQQYLHCQQSKVQADATAYVVLILQTTSLIWPYLSGCQHIKAQKSGRSCASHCAHLLCPTYPWKLCILLGQAEAAPKHLSTSGVGASADQTKQPAAASLQAQQTSRDARKYSAAILDSLLVSHDALQNQPEYATCLLYLTLQALPTLTQGECSKPNCESACAAVDSNGNKYAARLKGWRRRSKISNNSSHTSKKMYQQTCRHFLKVPGLLAIAQHALDDAKEQMHPKQQFIHRKHSRLSQTPAGCRSGDLVAPDLQQYRLLHSESDELKSMPRLYCLHSAS